LFKQSLVVIGASTQEESTKQQFWKSYKVAWNQGMIGLGRKQKHSATIDTVKVGLSEISFKRQQTLLG
jgi:hypothetical protein